MAELQRAGSLFEAYRAKVEADRAARGAPEIETSTPTPTAGPVEAYDYERAARYAGLETLAETAAAEGACSMCFGSNYVIRRRRGASVMDDNGRPAPCPRCAAERHERRWKAIGIHALLRFEDWQPVAIMEPVRKACDELIAGKRWCVFASAPTGRGKTHLAIATVVAWVTAGKGTAQFRTVPELMDELRSTYDDSSGHTITERMRVFEDAGLLVLDDLGAEKGSDWVSEKLFRIIDHRSLEKKPTFVTTNARPGSETIPARIRSRLAPGAIEIQGGADYRQSQAPMPYAE